jgi:hypothetical protein
VETELYQAGKEEEEKFSSLFVSYFGGNNSSSTWPWENRSEYSGRRVKYLGIASKQAVLLVYSFVFLFPFAKFSLGNQSVCFLVVFSSLNFLFVFQTVVL